MNPDPFFDPVINKRGKAICPLLEFTEDGWATVHKGRCVERNFDSYLIKSRTYGTFWIPRGNIRLPNTKYSFCDIDAAEHGTFVAKVRYKNSQKVYQPSEVKYNGQWISIEEFEQTQEGQCYSCENYR